MIKNKRVKVRLARDQLTQNDLADILHVTPAEASIMLKYDLSRAEQDELIRKIDEWVETINSTTKGA